MERDGYMVVVTTEGIDQCRHCGICFISKKWLNYHLVWHHKSDGY